MRVDDSFISDLPDSYKALIDTSMFPKVTFTLVLVSPDYTAYYEAVRNDIDACDKQIRSLLANNNFDLSSDSSADFYVCLATIYEEGGKVSGELYDMKECFASLNLKIYDNKTRI